MTLLELGQKVYSGAFIIAGELRGCGVEEAGFVDKKSGIAEKSLVLTYLIECTLLGSIEFAKITRRFKLGDETADKLKQAVHKGTVYAFNIVRFEKKPGYISAIMAPFEPVPVEAVSPPASAPSGAVPDAKP